MVWNSTKIGNGQLVLHCGGEQVDRSQLMTLPAPQSCSDTHFPIGHGELVTQTIANVEALGVKVNMEAHALSHNGDRYFGLFGIAGHDMPCDDDGYQLVIGLRNSHDRSYQASLALGNRVFVCDNLSFGGEVSIARKHTRHILRDLPGLMHGAVSKIVSARVVMEKRIEQYKDFQLDDLHAHDLIVRSLEAKIVSPPKIESVLKEWKHPSHDEFAPRTAWSLFNAYTETLKQYHVEGIGKRSSKLYGMFDAACGCLALAT